MDLTTKYKLFKITSVTGAMFINCVGRPFKYWGNMSVYMMSFLVIRGYSQTMIQNYWFTLCYNLFWSIGMFVSEAMANILKVRTVIFLGILMCGSFFFGSAFAGSLSLSWNAYVFVLGALLGFGIGLYDGLVIKHYIAGWSNDNDSRILPSLYMCSPAVGAIVLNYFMTWWINPNDLSPDFAIGAQHVFSQEEILDRVPRMFLMAGGAIMTMQLLGLCFLRDKNGLKLNEFTTSVDNYNTFKPDHREKNAVEEEAADKSNSGHDDRVDNSGISLKENASKSEDAEDTLCDFICNRDFQKLWVIQFCMANLIFMFSQYYKVYGQEYIKNDHLLTDIGMSMSLSAIVYNILAGVVMEKVSIKFVMITISSLSSVLCISMYFTAMINEWLYFACVLAGNNFSSTYLVLICATKTLFGTRHFSRNLGMVETATIVNNITTSMMIEIVLRNFGWLCVFVCSSMMAFVALCCTILTFPDI